VILLTSDVNCDIRKVAEAIAGDPALAAEALKIANSGAANRSTPWGRRC
jgi:HD-like signal output (HDOD) protein